VRSSYKCDQYYSPNNDSGIIYNESTLNIDWKLDSKDIIISDKDKLLPKFK
jgi:dTDP-4-dehydrorhamnose 3,5-epimerase